MTVSVKTQVYIFDIDEQSLQQLRDATKGSQLAAYVGREEDTVDVYEVDILNIDRFADLARQQGCTEIYA